MELILMDLFTKDINHSEEEKENGMKSILMDLYNKHIYQSEEQEEKNMCLYLRKNNPEYSTIFDELVELENSIINNLDAENMQLFEQVSYHRTDLEILKISYAFAEGFILAMKIASEVATTKTTIEK